MKRLLIILAASSVPVSTVAFTSAIYIERQDRAEQRFFDLFPEWWASHTACMTPSEELELIRQLAPDIAARIDSTNAEFEELAAREVVGTLTVSEREVYLDHYLRVPHLVQTGSEGYDGQKLIHESHFPSMRAKGHWCGNVPLMTIRMAGTLKIASATQTSTWVSSDSIPATGILLRLSSDERSIAT